MIPYFWYCRTRFPERFGQRCFVLARGAMNSALVQFEDGYRVITSRNYLRSEGFWLKIKKKLGEE